MKNRGEKKPVSSKTVFQKKRKVQKIYLKKSWPKISHIC